MDVQSAAVRHTKKIELHRATELKLYSPKVRGVQQDDEPKGAIGEGVRVIGEGRGVQIAHPRYGLCHWSARLLNRCCCCGSVVLSSASGIILMLIDALSHLVLVFLTPSHVHALAG